MASNVASTPKKEERSLGERMVWILLVVFVPLIVGVIVIGGALQFIGVPVWQTTLQVTGFSKSAKVAANNGQVTALQAKVKQLTAQNSQLTQKTAQLQQSNAHLKSQLSGYQKQASIAQKNTNAGQQEAKVLGQMDPAMAAKILVKMGASNAGWAVAAMSPQVSGPILQNAPTSFSTSVLQAAANDSLTTSQGSSKQTANSTNSAITSSGQ